MLTKTHSKQLTLSATPSRASASLLACAALALVPVLGGAGCGLIKLNGKPLGSSSSGGSGGGGGSDAEPIAAAAGSSQPGENSRRAALGAPASPLCKKATPDNSGKVSELEQALATKEPEYAAEALVAARCATEGELASERERVKQLGAAWMEGLHLDDRDVASLFLMARGQGDTLQDPKDLPGPVGEYGRIVGDTFQRMVALDELGRDASVMARVAVVRSCFGLGLAPYQPGKPYPLGLSILCTREPIELASADAEIDSTGGLGDSTRQRLRTDAWRASEAVRQHRQALAVLGEQDPGVGKLVALADKEFKQWAAPTPRRAELIATLEAMEVAASSNKRSAFAGCEDKTVAAWSKVVRGVKLPTTPKQHPEYAYARATLATAEGYLAYSALRICSEASETQGTRPARHAVPTMHMRRGPRSAAVASWAAVEEPIRFDDRDLDLSDIVGGLGMKPDAGSSTAELRQGVIASLQDIEGGVKVTFKTERVRLPTCTKERQTNRLLRIAENGTLEYEVICVATAMVMTDVTAAPVAFGKAMAHGLAPGMFLVAMDGLPVVATASPGSSEPRFVLGATLR